MSHMKRILPVFFLAASVWADALSIPGALRVYPFTETEGEEVANIADCFPGKIAVTGGPKGSMTIWEAPVRVPGHRAGSHAVRFWHPRSHRCLYRAGITGKEFAGGASFALWFRVPDAGGVAVPLKLGFNGDRATCGFELFVEREASGAPGRLVLSLARGKGAEPLELVREGVAPDIWHQAAFTIDGRMARLYLDDLAAPAAEAPFGVLIPPDFAGTYGAQPFFENRYYTPFLHVGAQHTAGTFDDLCPFDIDFLAVYGRALASAELAGALGPSAEGSPDEQLAAAAAADAAVARARSFRVKVPDEQGGYVRRGEAAAFSLAIPASEKADGPFVARFTVRALDGDPIETREISVEADGVAETSFAFETCGVYRVEIEASDRTGAVAYQHPRTVFLGVVPPRPERLDSPFGLCTVRGRWGYDTNLRRVQLHEPSAPGRAFDIHPFDYAGPDGLTGMERWQGVKRDELRRFVCGAFWSQGDFSQSSRFVNEMPPDVKAHYRAFYERAAQFFKTNGVHEFEATSEVNTRTTAGAYMDCFRILHEAYTNAIPDAKFYPPGATPNYIPFTAELLRLGIGELVDGLSLHNYITDPIHELHWNGAGWKLRALRDEWSAKLGKPLSLHCTEAGVFSLPRIRDRPMTREEALAAGYPQEGNTDYRVFATIMPTLPERESAAFQQQAALVTLAMGFESYIKSEGPIAIGVETPNEQGVAITALSGQVLNGFRACREVPLASKDDACVIVERKDGSRVAAVFARRPVPLTFRAEPGAVYRTMDLLGNFSGTRASEEGLVLVHASFEPVYLFDVPPDFAQVTPLALATPADLPDDGVLPFTASVTNLFDRPLAATLEIAAPPGATVEPAARTQVALAPGAATNVAGTMRGPALKRREWSLRATLRADGAEPDATPLAAAESIFRSPGALRIVQRAPHPMPLDGDTAKWAFAQPVACATEADVVHGKPDIARLWDPQWRGPDDLSLTLRTAYVEGHAMAFLLEVRDDACVPPPAGRESTPWNYDCLELFIDMRQGSELGTQSEEGADQALVTPALGETVGPCRVLQVRGARAHADVKCVGRRTADGYLIEGRIAPNEKSGFRVLPGSVFRMDFLVDDTDGDTELRKAAIAVDGVFRNYANVAAWGRYELGAD
jgi:hypothetical protein